MDEVSHAGIGKGTEDGLREIKQDLLGNSNCITVTSPTCGNRPVVVLRYTTQTTLIVILIRMCKWG